MANVGAKEQKIIVGTNTEGWKVVKGVWYGSSKNNGKRGCGVGVEGVDRDRWITISKIAVLLGTGTAMAAEVMGVCVLPGILDLVLHKSLSVRKYQSVYRRNSEKNIDVVAVQNFKLEELGEQTSDFISKIAEEGEQVRCREHPTFGQT